MHPEIREQINAIAADHLSGATDITRKAADILASLPVYSDAMEAGAFRAELAEVARELTAAQPSMTSLLTLVNHVLLAGEEQQDFGRLMAAVQHTAEDFGEKLADRPAEIAQTALALIDDDATIMTISSSSTVLAVLAHAQEAGKRIHVICPESRPQREGIDFAKQLAETEIDVTLIVDAGITHFMIDADVVMFGADTISPKGLVNKIGTYALALAADAHGVPAYGLAGTEKFLPAELMDRFRIEQQDPREILNEPVHPRLDIVNVYFDLTPLHFLAGVVTQDQVLTPGDVEEQLEAIEVHPALLSN